MEMHRRSERVLRLGDNAAANRFLDLAASAVVRHPLVAYNRACHLALSGSVFSAAQHALAAAGAGLRVSDHLPVDADFAAVLPHPDMHCVLLMLKAYSLGKQVSKPLAQADHHLSPHTLCTTAFTPHMVSAVNTYPIHCRLASCWLKQTATWPPASPKRRSACCRMLPGLLRVTGKCCTSGAAATQQLQTMRLRWQTWSLQNHMDWQSPPTCLIMSTCIA